MLKPFIAAACLCAAAVAQAQPVAIVGQEITDLVSGATVEIDTPLGAMPIRYAADGKVSGQAGNLASYLGAETDTGRWWVAGDQLCHRWVRWFDAEPQCLRLRKDGRTIYRRSQDGNSGRAVIVVPAPVRVAAAQPPPNQHPPMEAAPTQNPPSQPTSFVTASVLPGTQMEFEMHLIRLRRAARTASPPLTTQPVDQPTTTATVAAVDPGASKQMQASSFAAVRLGKSAPLSPAFEAPVPLAAPGQAESKFALYTVANVDRDDVLTSAAAPLQTSMWSANFSPTAAALPSRERAVRNGAPCSMDRRQAGSTACFSRARARGASLRSRTFSKRRKRTVDRPPSAILPTHHEPASRPRLAHCWSGSRRNSDP